MSDSFQVIDGDGHVIEDSAAIFDEFPPEWNLRRDLPVLRGAFPPLDHLHHTFNDMPEGSFTNPGPEGWRSALDKIGLAASVLYPTIGLGAGRFAEPELAVATCGAYNTWLHKTYLHDNARLKGMAVIPMQDPAAAVAELRRAVTELGFIGAFLPATGLMAPLGDPIYWPVYAEGHRLGCGFAVHGGSYAGLGLDHMNVFAASHALGHPVGIATAMASLVFNDVFGKFPGTRFAFLEGGVGWFVMAMERFDGSYASITPKNLRGKHLQMRPGDPVSGYVRELMAAGRLAIGVEGEEAALAWAVKEYGPAGFMYTSDFPHEVTIEACRDSINGIVEHSDLTDEDKRMILSGTAARFYGIDLP